MSMGALTSCGLWAGWEDRGLERDCAGRPRQTSCSLPIVHPYLPFLTLHEMGVAWLYVAGRAENEKFWRDKNREDGCKHDLL